MKHINIPVFVPHIGCPNACTFCNQNKITANLEPVTAKDVERIADEHLLTIDRDNTFIEIAFFGGSFTGIDKELQRELLSVAYGYKKSGKIDGIRLSTRPDYIDDEIMQLLIEYGVTAIELGVQSSDDEVLEANRRGHTFKDVINAVETIRKYDVKLGLQIMPGLYNSDYEKDIKTGLDIIALKPDFVRIYPTLVIKETCLCDLYDRGEFTPLTVEDAVKISAYLVHEFSKNGIEVIRVGLLGSENISTDSDVVAGPFHPAFGELVTSRVYLDSVFTYLEKEKTDKLEIRVNPAEMSKMCGQKRCNIEKLEEKYAFVSVKSDKEIKPKHIMINDKLIKIL